MWSGSQFPMPLQGGDGVSKSAVKPLATEDNLGRVLCLLIATAIGLNIVTLLQRNNCEAHMAAMHICIARKSMI
jgi:hypothetical protein